MAIYPILQGQVAHQRVIPQRHVSPETTKNHASEGNGDLVDFGQNDDPVPAKSEPPTKSEPSTKSEKHNSSEISNLLESTGQKVDGPLLDFTKDLKKDLPTDKTMEPRTLQRVDTGESNDVFFDTEG